MGKDYSVNYCNFAGVRNVATPVYFLGEVCYMILPGCMENKVFNWKCDNKGSLIEGENASIKTSESDSISGGK